MPDRPIIEIQKRNELPLNVTVRMYMLGNGYTVDGAVSQFTQKFGPPTGRIWKCGNFLYIEMPVGMR